MLFRKLSPNNPRNVRENFSEFEHFGRAGTGWLSRDGSNSEIQRTKYRLCNHHIMCFAGLCSMPWVARIELIFSGERKLEHQQFDPCQGHFLRALLD